MRFRNRREAGQRLAKALAPHVHEPAIVYALPRGGVPVAVEVALALKLPLELLIARKVGHPMQPEYAVCAVTEGGQSVCDPAQRAHLDPGWVADRLAEGRAEAVRRREVYSGAQPRRLATGHCAILVDDGIATGLTMQAAIEDVRADGPSRIIVAVAVSPAETAERFRQLCDTFVAAHIPAFFDGAVGMYYEDFPQLSDDDVLREVQRIHKLPTRRPKRAHA